MNKSKGGIGDSVPLEESSGVSLSQHNAQDASQPNLSN